MQEELRKSLEEKRELSRRVNELTKIRQNLKDKIGQMEKHQEILVKNTDGKKVSELMGYVDKQRNIYRNSVKQLLNKLDPDKKTLEEFEREYTEDLIEMVHTGPSSKVNMNVIQGHAKKSPSVQVIKNYVPSEYDQENLKDYESKLNKKEAEIESLKLSTDQLELKYKTQNQELQLKISDLEDKLARSQQEISALQHKLQRNFGQIREETMESKEKYQENVATFHKEIQTLRKDLETKESFVKELLENKDILHDQLDEKTLKIEDLKKKMMESENKRISMETENSGQFRRVADCLTEIKELQDKLRVYETKNDQIQTRILGEQEFSRELRMENTKLKTELTALKSDSEEKYAKIEDMRAHIQRYVTEVKRIEEILAIREKERKDLLEQYQHLNDEAESSASYGRKMESKVSVMAHCIRVKKGVLRFLLRVTQNENFIFQTTYCTVVNR